MELTKAEIKNLKDKDYRHANKIFLVEGDKFCHDLLNADIDILQTVTTNSELKGFKNTIYVNKKTFDSLATTKTPQSIICVCKIKEYGIDAVGNSLVLDNVQDPGNVGTLIRSALAFNFNDIYLIGGADPYTEKVIRGSAGTILKARLHLVSFKEFEISKTKIAENFLIADMFGGNLNKIRLPKGRISVIIGNEGNGVSSEMRALANGKVSIPMMPCVESLNAGVAGSIIMQKIGNV